MRGSFLTVAGSAGVPASAEQLRGVSAAPSNKLRIHSTSLIRSIGIPLALNKANAGERATRDDEVGAAAIHSVRSTRSNDVGEIEVRVMKRRLVIKKKLISYRRRCLRATHGARELQKRGENP